MAKNEIRSPALKPDRSPLLEELRALISQARQRVTRTGDEFRFRPMEPSDYSCLLPAFWLTCKQGSAVMEPAADAAPAPRRESPGHREGKMDMYVRMMDDLKRASDDNLTVRDHSLPTERSIGGSVFSFAWQ